MYHKATPEMFWSRVKKGPDNECWPWQGMLDRAGYGRQKYRGTKWFAHRLALNLSGCEVMPYQFVLHSCDNPPCCNPAHLRIGTPKDNMADASARKRLQQRGIPKPRKLTDDDRRQIQMICGVSFPVIAELYGIHRTYAGALSRAKNRA